MCGVSPSRCVEILERFRETTHHARPVLSLSNVSVDSRDEILASASDPPLRARRTVSRTHVVVADFFTHRMPR